MIIQDFIQYISLEKHYSNHTVTAYENDLSAFSKFLNKQFEITSMADVNRDIVRSWIIELIEEGKSNITINRKLSTLKSFFNFLIKSETITTNPVKNINSLKIPSSLPYFLTKEKMNHYYDSKTDFSDFNTLRDFLVIDLLYTTGMRLS